MSPILIVGQNGQLARALSRSLVGLGRPFETVGSKDIDLATSPEAIAAYITSQEYTAVINASAYTDVDDAEEGAPGVTCLNTIAPGEMAKACAEKSIPFIHISTDYVFEGLASQPYKPDALIKPINAYGRSKAKGETAVMKAGGASVTLRTSWLYDGTGKNFLTTMLKLANTRNVISVVDDQIGRPTYAGHLATACLAMLEHMPDVPKVYHVSNTGDPISWAAFARAIFDLVDMDCVVTPIPSRDYPTPAARPKYSVMDTQAFEDATGHFLPHWRDGLRDALAERL